MNDKSLIKRTMNTLVCLICGISLTFNACAGGPNKWLSDAKGRLLLENQSGANLAAYADKAYIGTMKPGQTLNTMVDNVGAAGKIVEVEVFPRDKLTNPSNYPINQEALMSFPKTVRSLSDPDPVIPVVLRKLTTEELATNAGVNNVLIKISYNDLPRIVSSVSLFTGSTAIQNALIRLDNGQSKLVPVPVGYHTINLMYLIGGGKTIQRRVYPESPKQRDDRRFAIYVPAGTAEIEYEVPLIGDIYNVSFARQDPASKSTIRVINRSSSQTNILIGGGTKPEERINGQDSVVLNHWPYRDFLVSAGNYYFRAVNAVAGGSYSEIARINDIDLEPGLIYYWYITDNTSVVEAGVNMHIPQQIKNWFQEWGLRSIPEDTKISLRISSTTNDVKDSRRELGYTDKYGQLIKRVDIEDMIRGLRTENAKKVTLTLIAERDGYYPAMQAISAWDLLQAGKNFRPDVFSLEKIDEMANAELIIGDPLIQ